MSKPGQRTTRNSWDWPAETGHQGEWPFETGQPGEWPFETGQPGEWPFETGHQRKWPFGTNQQRLSPEGPDCRAGLKQCLQPCKSFITGPETDQGTSLQSGEVRKAAILL